MIPLSDWDFDIEKELERKTVETLSWLTDTQQLISDAQALVGYQAINMTTRGLIDPEINAAVDDEIGKLSEQLHIVETLYKDDQYKVLRLEPQNAKIKVFDGRFKQHELDTPQQAKELFDRLIKALRSKGYKTINWEI